MLVSSAVGIIHPAFTDQREAVTRVAEVANNYPGKLTIEVPDNLRKGEYILEVRSVRRGTKTLQKGRLNETLVVMSGD